MREICLMWWTIFTPGSIPDLCWKVNAKPVKTTSCSNLQDNSKPILTVWPLSIIVRWRLRQRQLNLWTFCNLWLRQGFISRQELISWLWILRLWKLKWCHCHSHQWMDLSWPIWTWLCLRLHKCWKRIWTGESLDLDSLRCHDKAQWLESTPPKSFTTTVLQLAFRHHWEGSKNLRLDHDCVDCHKYLR